MTVITLCTIGFGEVHPLTPRSRIFVSIFSIVGIGIFLYGIVQLGELVIRAELQEWWRKRNMDQELKSIKNHFIVCGCGRIGLPAAWNYHRRNSPRERWRSDSSLGHNVD